MKFSKNNPKKADKTLDFTVTKIVQTKDASGEAIIEGYANTKSKDRVGDVVLPVSFEKTLPIYMTNPVMLENHDWDKPAGFIIEAKTDENGLWVRARISDARPDLKTMCAEGTLRTFSIGYNEVLADYDTETKTKIIQELELLEISIVTVPANAEAIFAPAGSAAAPKPAEAAPAAEEPAKAAPAPKSAKELKDFIADVKGACERELSTTEVEACCDYFLSNEEIMKKYELIALLKKATLDVKSAEKAADAAPGAVPAAAAAGSGSAGTTQPAGNSEQAPEWAKQLAAKLDAIAQGVAQCLEGMKDPEEKPAGEKPADESKPGDKPADDDGKGKPADAGKPADDSDEDDKEASEEDMEKHLAEIAKLEAELEGIQDEA